MVPATIPFAVAAAFFPPALAVMIWLLATPPGTRRALIYLGGAATSTVVSGALIMVVLSGVDIDASLRTQIEAAVQVTLGSVFVIVALGLVIRQPRLRPRDTTVDAPRLRAGGYAGIYLLGVVMWMPSFAYIAAIDLIVDSDLALPHQILNLLLVDLIVLATVEIPLLLHLLVPTASTRVVARLDDLARRYAWQLGTLTAGGGGIYLIVRGSLELAA